MTYIKINDRKIDQSQIPFSLKVFVISYPYSLHIAQYNPVVQLSEITAFQLFKFENFLRKHISQY
jgi:hypothetical protein